MDKNVILQSVDLPRCLFKQECRTIRFCAYHVVGFAMEKNEECIAVCGAISLYAITANFVAMSFPIELYTKKAHTMEACVCLSVA